MTDGSVKVMSGKILFPSYCLNSLSSFKFINFGTYFRAVVLNLLWFLALLYRLFITSGPLLTNEFFLKHKRRLSTFCDFIKASVVHK